MHTHNVAQVRLWQSLVVLTSFVPREEGGAAVDAVLLQLNGNNPPTVKQYMEAVVAALVMRDPALLHSRLLPLVARYTRHAAGLGSFILIAAQAFLVWERHRLRDELSEREVERLYASQDPSAFAGVMDAAASSSSSGGGKKQQQQQQGGTAAATAGGGGIGDFQRKITPEALLAELGVAAAGAGGAADVEGAGGGGGGGGLASLLLLEGEDEAGDWKAASASASRRHDILLVASLIDKRGIIRSLNVHVTGAIALYDYVRKQQQPAPPGAVVGAAAGAAAGAGK
eukprot:XP_001690016.1 predicted protein [Chlamydomonas reinhardtii]